jgi:thioredoxin:protein disulfide reductase
MTLNRCGYLGLLGMVNAARLAKVACHCVIVFHKLAEPTPTPRLIQPMYLVSRFGDVILRLALKWVCLGVAMVLPMIVVAAEFLEPERAFRVQVVPAGDRAVEVRIDVVPGYYLYRDAFKFEAAGATLGAALIPAGKVKFDETFQKNVETHRGQVRLQVAVEGAGAEFKLAVTTQGCADAGLCYPPMTTEAQVSLAGFGGTGTAWLLAAPAAGAMVSAFSAGSTAAIANAPPAGKIADDETLRVAQLLSGGSLWRVMAGFLVLGLLLSLTPCVMPMLPILSSIIVGHGEAVSRTRSMALAASYSLGMALVYTVLGVAAGLMGEGLAAALQNPWALFAFAGLLVLLSLSMFDVFELRLPAAVEQRLTDASQSQGGGRFVGVFAMGSLSALIVSPCVSAPLAGALLFISQTRDVALGGFALFALSIGMSVPLLLIGASAGSLLPRAGAWMVDIKRFFGLMLLGVAIYIAQPAVSPWLALIFWGCLALLGAWLAWPRTQEAASLWRKVTAIGFATLGLTQWVGSATGAGDPTRPLAVLLRSPDAPTSPLVFKPIQSLWELEQALANTQRPVVLDFYADWCVSCKEMERFTFAQPTVAAKMGQALLLKADVTANSEAHRELLKRFKLFGPPGIIFFDAKGQELPAVRVIGFQDATRFTQSLQAAGL